MLIDINALTIKTLCNALCKHVWDSLKNDIRSNPRLYLLHDREEPLPDGSYKRITSTLRHYLLQVSITDHRHCLTNLLLGYSTFRSLSLHGVPDEARVCRACLIHRETPEHAILQCSADLCTVTQRAELFDTIGITLPKTLSDDAAIFYLKKIIFHWDWVPHTARFVHSVTATWWDMCAKKATVGDKQLVLDEDDDMMEDMGDADMVDQALYVAGL